MPIGDAALVVLISAMTCVLVGGPAIRWLARAQCVAPVRYEDCPPLQAYQQKKSATPTMGGLFVLAVAAAVAVMAGGLSHRDGWLVLLALIGMGGVGWWDDCLKFRGENARGLRTWPKLLMALMVGAVIGLGTLEPGPAGRPVQVPWTSQTIALGGMWVPMSMVAVAGCAHAVNLTDGMDGLAAGCVAIALLALGFLSPLEASSVTWMAWAAGLAGACLGFLWFNCFPASIYLGDVGALGLGAALGTLGLLTHGALWLIIVGGIFVVEAVSVMLQVASYKWRSGRRIFRVAPIHHHFHLGGLSEPKVIVRFWIAGALLAAASLSWVSWR